jgi:SAM-dependent methyltransferase
MSGFGGTLTSLLNASATSTALGVASRTGLLAALGAEPRSSAELAALAAGGMTPRWADEILAVLVCGDVVVLGERPVLHPAGTVEELKYSLPADRKEALDGMGLYFEELPLLNQCAFAEVCDAAATGGSVPPERYSAFGAWMGKLADEKHARQLTQTFLPALDGGSIVATLQRGDAQVVDLGCGEGAAARLIAAAFPAAHVVGVDINAASVAAAQAHPDAAGLANLEFRVGDVSSLCTDAPALAGRFDLVLSFDAIHDLPDPSGAMRSARSLLKLESGAVFAMVDIRAGTGLRQNLGHDMGAFLYCVSLMHCMPQGLACDSCGRPGEGLGMMWGRGKAQAMLSEAGFRDVSIVELEFDSFNDVYLCRPGAAAATTTTSSSSSSSSSGGGSSSGSSAGEQTAVAGAAGGSSSI